METGKWILKCCDESAVKRIAGEFGLSEIVARLLLNRGIDDGEKIKAFLEKEGSFNDPFALADMDRAVERINRALADNESICVYGDYDVDGVTSTAALVLYLRSRGAACSYYIPDRTEEGYGINTSALDRIRSDGTTLLITVDSGVTALNEIAYANTIGLDVVVTDHHECAETLPDAAAVVNPKRRDCGYPFKELAGVGVVFKLMCALDGQEKKIAEQYIDMVAVGTIADVMPLLGENRSIVKRGLDALKRSQRPGIKALLEAAGVKQGKKITSGVISFSLAPRINAAGRMGGAARAAELFITDDPFKAESLARELCQANVDRQAEENKIMGEARALLEQRGFSPQKERIIVLWGEGWHNGVIGIAASRLCDTYHCPAILISFDGDVGRGSGRSTAGFNLYEALCGVSQYLDKFGGHELAAGITIKRENLNAFCSAIGAYANERISAEDMVRRLEVDCELGADALTADTVRDISVLEPYGVSNAVPQFIVRDMNIDDIVPISNDKHIRLTLSKGDAALTAFVFSTPPSQMPFVRNDTVDVVCSLDINNYRGYESAQMIIKDMRINEEQLRSIEKSRELYEKYRAEELSGAEAELALPDRDTFVSVYRYIKQNSDDGAYSGRADTLNREIAWYSRNPVSFCRLMICLDVMGEFGLAAYEVNDERISITLYPFENKVDLNKSRILLELKRMRDKE